MFWLMGANSQAMLSACARTSVFINGTLLMIQIMDVWPAI
jgi:hypothetical protein